MKRYETYKDSGIQWVGEIPSHWDVVKTSYLFDDIGSGTTPNTNDDSLYDTDNGINWLQTGDLNDGHITKTSKKISQKAIEGNGTLRLYPINSLVIALYGATIGKVGVLDIESTTNQACCVLPPSDKISTDYAYYIFLASKEALLNLASGGGQPNISQAIIKNHRIPYPSYAEQQSIVSFLDHKVGQIDATIAEKEQMLEDLKNYRSAIISEAVTKGLDRNVEMKDSGIEWMGRVPKHWKISKLKYTGAFDNGLTYSPEDVVEKGILVLRSSNIQNGHLSFDDCVYVKNAPSDLMVEDGDIIICSRNGSANLVGKCAFVDHIENSSFGAFMMRFRPCIHKKFAFYAFQASTSSYKGLYSTSTINQITKAVIDQMFMVVPPIEEQESIADYIDKKITNIDSSLTEIDSQISDLKSYKSALITEAVTGKIDLREWKPKEENV